MTKPEQPTARPIAPPVDRAASRIDSAKIFGVLLALAGVVVGIVMAAHRREIECPNGTEFGPDETDFRCFSHPHVAEGVGLIVVSLLLGILIVLVAWTASRLTDSRRHETGAEAGSARPGDRSQSGQTPSQANE